MRTANLYTFPLAGATSFGDALISGLQKEYHYFTKIEYFSLK